MEIGGIGVEVGVGDGTIAAVAVGGRVGARVGVTRVGAAVEGGVGVLTGAGAGP